MIKSIVVPTDGSEHADRAVELATEIASKYDAQLTILNVLLYHASTPELTQLCKRLNASSALLDRINSAGESMAYTTAVGYAPVATPVPPKLLKEVGELIVEEAKKKAAVSGVSQIATKVTDGSPANRITEEARATNADLIVMGRRGLGKYAGILMGSVSHKVSHLADCACITVK